MKAESIKDPKSLEAWLKARPKATRQSDAVVIAVRAALRVFPLWSGAMGADWARKADLTALPILRPNLTSGVARKDPTSEVKAASDFAGTDAAAAALAAAEADAFAAAFAADAARLAVDAFAANFAAADAALAAAHAAQAAYRVAAHAAARADVWSAIREDAAALEKGPDPSTQPLWPNTLPDWFTEHDTKAREIWARDPGTWSFWTRWWDGALSGTQLDWDLQRHVALIPDDIWQQGPAAVAQAIREIEKRRAGDPQPEPPVSAAPLARAFLFDFVEHDQKLRMTGIALHFEGRSDDDIAACLRKLRDWKEDLQDWLDYAQDHLSGSNERCGLARSAHKLTTLIEAIKDPRDFPAGRLVTMGGNLRLLAADEKERTTVGDTLAKMMDARLDELSALLGMCFGHVLAQLEPLNSLALGAHDPAALIDGMQQALSRLRNASPDELLQLDDATRATFAEMIRELQELDAAIASATNPKQVALLKERFASRYGGLAATIGRSVEKGREGAKKAVSKFDNWVKWYKRWETLERIVEWLGSLGNGGPPPGL